MLPPQTQKYIRLARADGIHSNGSGAAKRRETVEQYVLEMRGIVKIFPGVRALDGVNLQIRPGKTHVICGENGAGKSTLIDRKSVV